MIEKHKKRMGISEATSMYPPFGKTVHWEKLS